MEIIIQQICDKSDVNKPQKMNYTKIVQVYYARCKINKLCCKLWFQIYIAQTNYQETVECVARQSKNIIYLLHINYTLR